MAIADNGGGGLTLQRVLQCDLDKISLFIHVQDYATKISPIAHRYANRQLNLNELYPLPSISRLHWRLRRGYLGQLLHRVHQNTVYGWSMDLWSRRLARHILRHIDLTNCFWLVVPQDIYSVLVMNRVWRSNPVPYVTWVMDDHVLRWHNKWRYAVPGFEKEFQFHLRHAQSVITISPSMQQFYNERFGVESNVIFGPADPIDAPVFESPSPSSPVRLAYFGSIWAWQRDALSRLIDHLAEIDATLDVFGFHGLPPELQSSRVGVRPVVPANDVISHMRQYDGVVIPAGYSDDVRHLSALNISTKLSESLACGTVPVLIAPSYAAMVQFGKKHGGVVIVDDFDDPTQIDALRALKSSALRNRILTQAQRVVARECSTEVMRARWKKAWHRRGDQVPRVEPVSENVAMHSV
jgi:glycosyltransferase involved in cell wall biosynthesis